MISDGCTGFWLFQWIWPAITACCTGHDGGMSDGWLLDCLEHAIPLPPLVAAILATAGVAIMALWRPLYHLFKRRK